MSVVFDSGISEVIGNREILVNDLCTALNWHEEFGSRFIETLISVGFLEKKNNLIILSEFSKKYLLKESVNYQGETLRFEKKLVKSWKTLGNILKTGEREFNKEEKSHKDYIAALENYIDAMDETAKIRAKELWDSPYIKEMHK